MSKPPRSSAQASSSSALSARIASRTEPEPTINLVKSDLTEQPYILSTPSDKPYNLPPQHTDNWRVGRLFRSEEEHLQYQSFFWRDSAMTLFQLEAPHEEDHRRKEATLKIAGGLKSGAITPLHLQTNKKKISLSDYKKAKSSGQGATPVASASPIIAPVKPTVGAIARQTSSLNPKLASEIVSGVTTSTLDVSTVSANRDNSVEDPASQIPEVVETQSSQPVVKPESLVELLPEVQLEVKREVPRDVQGDVQREVQPEVQPEVLPEAKPEVQPEGKPGVQPHRVANGASEESSTTISGSGAAAQSLKRSHDEALGSQETSLVNDVHSPPPAKHPKLEHSADDSISNERNVSRSIVHDIPDAEVNGQQHEGKGDEQGGNHMPLTRDSVRWSSKKEVNSRSPMSPPTPTIDQPASNTRDRGLPGWIPGAPVWHSVGPLPPQLTDIPSWLNGYSSRIVHDHSKSPQSVSSPDTRLSATLSQTSYSSLSSTLIDVVQETLDEAAPAKPPRGPVLTSRVLSDTRTSDLASPQRSATQHEGKTKVSNDDSADNPEAPRSARKSVKSTAGINVSSAPVEKRVSGESHHLLPAAEILSGSKLIVRLKYGRGHVRNIQRILQLKPTPKREVPHASSAPSVAKTLPTLQLQDDEPAVGKVQTKRAREEDRERSSEPVSKRKKLDQHEAEEGPRTPTASSYSPITVTSASSLHRQVLTPKKDVKGMRSVVQALNLKSGTPQDRQGTPSASTENIGESSQGPERSSVSDESGIWAKEHDKTNELAKQLRKNAQALFKSMGTNKSGVDAKRGAIEGMESILCFMVAFLALGQYAHSPKTLIRAWQSLVPWGSEICRASQPFPHLYGLSLLLRTAYCTVIATQHGRMSSADIASFGSESDVLQQVSLNLRRIQQSAEDGDRSLPRSALAAEYPLTFTEYQKLPPGMLVKTMGVVKMGLRFLGEWTRAENVDWKQRLEVGICSQLQ